MIASAVDLDLAVVRASDRGLVARLLPTVLLPVLRTRNKQSSPLTVARIRPYDRPQTMKQHATLPRLY